MPVYFIFEESSWVCDAHALSFLKGIYWPYWPILELKMYSESVSKCMEIR